MKISSYFVVIFKKVILILKAISKDVTAFNLQKFF